MMEPTWDTPARVIGLPCTNWKKRTGIELRGTLAQCVARWLDLQSHQQRECTLHWGDHSAGPVGTMGPASIGAFVIAHGLPPAVAAARGGQPSVERLREIVSMPRHEPIAQPYQPGLMHSIYKGKKK